MSSSSTEVNLDQRREEQHARGNKNANEMKRNAMLCEPIDGTGSTTACERACELNHSNSCANWGLSLLAEKPEIAIDVLARACIGGSGTGCEAESRLRKKAGDLERSEMKMKAARDYHRVHCSQGYARSCLALARLFDTGEGGPIDADTARVFREQGELLRGGARY